MFFLGRFYFLKNREHFFLCSYLWSIKVKPMRERERERRGVMLGKAVASGHEAEHRGNDGGDTDEIIKLILGSCRRFFGAN